MPLVEKRYAEAMVDLSVQNNAIDICQQELGTIAEIYAIQPDLKDFLLNPQADIETKKKILKNIFSGRLGNDIMSFLMLLLDKGRIKYLPGIYKEFVKLADEKRSILNITIITAVPLDPVQLKKLAEKYRSHYGAASVKVITELDTSLIGGVKVIIGDKLVDGSVKGRLKELQDMLVNI